MRGHAQLLEPLGRRFLFRRRIRRVIATPHRIEVS
jgi:hypothetical protein